MASTSTFPVRLSDLDVEDCCYVLRELELNAFSTVVAAMRAQGSLNSFKEVLLDSLKKAFFISDEVYKAELRKAGNDEFLSKIAVTLNPSYDTFTPWAMSCREVEEDRPIFPPPRLFQTKTGTTSTLSVADTLLKQAFAHNDKIADQDVITAKLLQIPKLPYVPEKLRKFLNDTETLSSGRMLPKEEEEVIPISRIISRKPLAPKPAALVPAPPPIKRKRKGRNGITDINYDESFMDFPINNKPSSSLSPSPVKTSDPAGSLLNLLPSKEAEARGVKEILLKIQAQVEQEQKAGLLDANGRRKRKPRLNTKELVQECARARPFFFLPRPHDGMKPVRGNPDRYSQRRSIPGASPVMVPPIISLNQGNIPVQVIPPVSLPHHLHGNQVMTPSPGPSTSYDHPIHKENAVRNAPNSLPLNHVINKPAMMSVSPATTPTGVIKRARLGSFNNEKLPTSPVDLTQRSAAIRKATYLPPVPATTKVKVAVTPPVEIHGQGTAIKTVVYGQSVTVNRAQSRTVSISKEGPVTQIIPQRPSPIPTNQPSASINELHGHDYTQSKTPGGVKKHIIASTVPTIRPTNGNPPLAYKIQPGGVATPILTNIALKPTVINQQKPTSQVAASTVIQRATPPTNTVTSPMIQKATLPVNAASTIMQRSAPPTIAIVQKATSSNAVASTVAQRPVNAAASTMAQRDNSSATAVASNVVQKTTFTINATGSTVMQRSTPPVSSTMVQKIPASSITSVTHMAILPMTSPVSTTVQRDIPSVVSKVAQKSTTNDAATVVQKTTPSVTVVTPNVDQKAPASTTVSPLDHKPTSSTNVVASTVQRSTPSVNTAATLPANAVTLTSPIDTQQANIISKYAPNNTTNQNIAQYMRNATTTQVAAELGPPPAKRLIYCDPKNPNVATIHMPGNNRKEEAKQTNSPVNHTPVVVTRPSAGSDGQSATTSISKEQKSELSRQEPPTFLTSSSPNLPENIIQDAAQRPEVIQPSAMEIS